MLEQSAALRRLRHFRPQIANGGAVQAIRGANPPEPMPEARADKIAAENGNMHTTDRVA